MIMTAITVVFMVLIGLYFMLIPGPQKKDNSFYNPPPPPLNTQKYKTAIHETGHLLAAWSCSHVTHIDAAKINVDGGAVLFHMKVSYELDNLWCNLVIILAGVAAEGVVYSKFRSIHASQDLMTAKEIARKILSSDPKYTPPSIMDGKSPDFSKVFKLISKNESNLLAEAYKHAQKIIKAYGNLFNKTAFELHEQGTLHGQKLIDILGYRAHIMLVGVFRPEFIYPGFITNKAA